MKKLFKYLVLPLVALIVLAGIALVVMFSVIDPNRYRPAIESVFADQTGFELRIAGDIDWSFRPVFGLDIRDVRLSNGVTPQELASFSEVSLRLNPRALIGGRLEMQEFIARNLYINWFVDEQGQANWLVNVGEPTAEPPPRDTEATEIPISFEIEQITISNATIAIRDMQQGIDTSLQNLNISSRNTNLENRPFPLEISTRIVDASSQQDLPVSLATNATIDFNAGYARLNDLRFTLSPLVLSGNVVVSDFHDNLSWYGNLASNTFTLSYLLENFMELDAGDGINTGSEQFSMQMAFNGDTRGASLSSMDIALDDMRAQLRGDMRFATDTAPAMIAYELSANDLDLERYLAAAQEEETPPLGDDPRPEAGPGVAVDEDPELPLDVLNTINIRGNHSIASLRAAGLQFYDINFSLVVQDGVLNLETQPIGFYDGTLATTLQLDASTSPAAIHNVFLLNGINASALTVDMPQLDFFRGQLDLEAEHSLRGDTVNELLDSITGLSSFNVSNNSIDITMLKRVFASISVLSPTGELAADWPDVVTFNTVEGQLLINDGLASGQELSIRMDNFDSRGTGGIDLAAETFHYDVDFTVMGEPAPQTIRVSRNYQNVPWPVECSASFDAPAAQYCSPNLQRVREVFAQIARDEVQRRAEDAVSEQVDRLQERARGLLDGLRQRAN